MARLGRPGTGIAWVSLCTLIALIPLRTRTARDGQSEDHAESNHVRFLYLKNPPESPEPSTSLRTDGS